MRICPKYVKVKMIESGRKRMQKLALSEMYVIDQGKN